MKSPLVLIQQTSCDWEVPTDSPPTPPPINTAPRALSETFLQQESRSQTMKSLIGVATVKSKLYLSERAPQCGDWLLDLCHIFSCVGYIVQPPYLASVTDTQCWENLMSFLLTRTLTDYIFLVPFRGALNKEASGLNVQS